MDCFQFEQLLSLDRSTKLIRYFGRPFTHQFSINKIYLEIIQVYIHNVYFTYFKSIK